MEKLKVKVIGCGGIGGCLLPVLCRILNYGTACFAFDDVDIHLIDGDIYEERNRERQLFRDRGNKADITKKMLEEDFPNLFIRSHPVYIDTENVNMLIEENDVVFLCVDNHKTRHLVTRHCEDTLQDVVLISGGNNLDSGNVQVFIRRGGWNQTIPLDESHPEIANPDDKHPSEIEVREGCLEQAVAEPQLLIANNFAAALMLNAFHGLVYREGIGVFSENSFFRYDEVHFDVPSNKARPFLSQQRPKAKEVLSER
jgi:molybdopterin/thiamine biosynthesis adenylyltransferase